MLKKKKSALEQLVRYLCKPINSVLNNAVCSIKLFNAIFLEKSNLKSPMIKNYAQILFFLKIKTTSKGLGVILLYFTSEQSRSSGPNLARPAVVSFSVQKQGGNLESSQLFGSQSPKHLNNSGASQGIVPNGRKKKWYQKCDHIY